MDTTRTETIDDVLGGLIQLAPERFVSRYTIRALLGTWTTNEPLIQVACQEEIATHGWCFDMQADTRTIDAEVKVHIWQGKNPASLVGSAQAGSPTLAIASALREALTAKARRSN